MTIKMLTAILDAHSITYEVTDGRVIADDNYTLDGIGYTEKIDLTDFSMNQLKDWLGY